jgi:hypothetical protein
VIVPFEFSVSPGAGTAAFGKLFDLTNNLNLASIIAAAVGGGSTNAAKLGDFGLADVLTHDDLIVDRLFIVANAAMKVELGLYKSGAGTPFASALTVYATEAIGGGVVADLDDGILMLNQHTLDANHWNLALKLTPDAAGTVKVSGYLRVRGRQPLPV